MKTKRLLMIAVMAVAAMSVAYAQKGVILTLRSGSTVAFAFERRPVMVTGSELTMQTADGASVSYAYNEVENVTWGDIDELTRVVDDAVAANGGSVVFRLTADGIQATGLSRGQTLSAYTVDGKRVGMVRAGDTEPVVLTLPEGRGVYVVRTSTGVSWKVSK